MSDVEILRCPLRFIAWAVASTWTGGAREQYIADAIFFREMMREAQPTHKRWSAVAHA